MDHDLPGWLDRPWPTRQRRHIHGLLAIRPPHGHYLTADGGAVCLPAHAQASLVSLVIVYPSSEMYRLSLGLYVDLRAGYICVWGGSACTMV